MEKITITSPTWQDVATSTGGDTLIAVQQGFGVLCFGDNSGVAEADGLSVSPGYQVIVPAGLDVSAAAGPGLNLVIIVSPFSAP